MQQSQQIELIAHPSGEPFSIGSGAYEESEINLRNQLNDLLVQLGQKKVNERSIHELQMLEETLNQNLNQVKQLPALDIVRPVEEISIIYD